MGKPGAKIIRALLWAVAGATAAVSLYVCAADMVPARAGQSPSGAAGRYASAVLDINAAGASALEELPQIGPVLAGRIVQAREETGPFSGPEALQQVPGLGPATWEAVEPFVYFGQEP